MSDTEVWVFGYGSLIWDTSNIKPVEERIGELQVGTEIGHGSQLEDMERLHAVCNLAEKSKAYSSS